jgi:hypothetical protein
MKVVERCSGRGFDSRRLHQIIFSERFKMFKINFIAEGFPSVSLFKIFKTKEQADLFIDDLGNRFLSLKII